MKIFVRDLDGKTVPLNVNEGDTIHVADLSIQDCDMNSPCTLRTQEQGNFASKEELRRSLCSWGEATKSSISVEEFCRLLKTLIPSLLDCVLALQLGGPSAGEAKIDDFVNILFSLHGAKSPPAGRDEGCVGFACFGRGKKSDEHKYEPLMEELAAVEFAEDGNEEVAGDNEEVRRWLAEFDHVRRPWDVHAFFEGAPSSLRIERSFMLPAVAKNGSALSYACDSMKADKEVVLAAVRQFGCALSYAHDSMKANKEAVLVAVQQDGAALQYAHNSMRKDEDVALAAVKQNGCALEHAHNSIKANKEVVLAAVQQRGFALYYAHDLMKDDKDVVLAAVRQDGSDLACALESMKAEKDVVLAAVQQRGNALRYAHACMTADKEVVMAAVQSDGDALQYASGPLRADKEIVLAAVHKKPASLKYARGGSLDLEQLSS